MIAGTLEIQMLANMARLASDMDAAKRSVGGAMDQIEKSVGFATSALQTLGLGLSVGYFTNLIRGSADALDHLNDLSKSTTLTVEQLAGLDLAAKQSGSNLNDMAASVNKLSQNMGNDAEKYARLGITAKEPLEAFKQLADIFVHIQDPQQRAAVMAEALGKSWAGAAPALAEGGQRLGEMIEKGTRLSGVTQANAERADQFNDQLVELNAVMEAAKLRMVGDMLPALAESTKAITHAYEESGKLQASWVALGSVGAFLYTDEFSSAAVKVAALKDKLAELETQKDMADNMPMVGAVPRWLFGSKDLMGDIERTKKAIVDLQALIDKPAQDAAANAAAQKAREIAAAEAAAKAKAFLEAQQMRAKEEKAAEEAARETKRLRELDNKGWVAYIDAQTREYEDGLAAERKLLEDNNAATAAARQKDLAGWVAYAEARVQEDFNMTQQIAKQQIAEAEVASKKLRDFWGPIERTAHDSFINIYKGGTDVFQKLTDTLNNSLLEVLYQMTIKKWIIQLETQMGGVPGAGGDNWMQSLMSLFAAGGGGGAVNMGTATGADLAVAFADGGDHAGGLRLVGERGPELEATGPSRIFNAQQTKDILGGQGQGAPQIHNSTVINVDARTDRAEVYTLTQRAVRQGNEQLIDMLQQQGVLAR